MKITQLVHTLNYGDAISGEVMTLSRVLDELGVKNEIISIHAHEKMKGLSRSLSSLGQAQLETDVLLLHYSLGSPLNDLYREFSGKRVLLYHNLTPPHWFESYNTRVYKDLVEGTRELPELIQVSDKLIADSSFNKEELVSHGGSDVQVLPLPFDETKWNIPANSGIAQALKGHGGINLLHVGRIAPNKKLEDIIKSFYFYHHKINEKSKLWLVGHDIDCEIYSLELRRLVSELRLKEKVEFVGSISDGELKAFYENSDCYICMSEHEGFCVPLLEAMKFELPIVAYSSSAIPETLGEAGVLLEKKSPALVSELVNEIISNSEYRNGLIASGRKRVESLSDKSFKERVSSLFLSEPELSNNERIAI